MKIFIKKNLGTMVMAPAFAFYILMLPAKNDGYTIEENVPESHTADPQIKNKSLVSGLNYAWTGLWFIRFGAPQ